LHQTLRGGQLLENQFHQRAKADLGLESQLGRRAEAAGDLDQVPSSIGTSS